MTLNSDFNTVKEIMEGFLLDDSIRKKLLSICRTKRNDWEKWFQLELEFYISSLKNFTVDREVKAIPDNRKMKERLNMFVDFAIRKKHTKKNSFIFIEIKCSTNPQALINGFNKDIKKINSIKSCNYDTRSFWCVGFHKNCTQKSIEKMVEYAESWKGHHEVIRLCDCLEGLDCQCKDNKIGFAIL
ncbi:MULTISPECIES: hypothetical protein [unclassified Pantoea]|uniref:hypothetical protein n=1 Tax=unclassified Pantoea TaxID=2630326 RepID=UPI0015D0CFB1|nr:MULTISPECIES: hypothetical protein [unclassified Pantoea]NYS29472.1 hypothetical protein [Pantoea sp. WMus005]